MQHPPLVTQNRDVFLRGISVVVPAINEEKYIEATLQSLRKNTSGFVKKIIVADGGSTDKTVPLACSYGSQIVTGGYPATARNAGAQYADTEYVLFLDADTTIPDNFFSTAFFYLNKRDAAIATFWIIPAERRPLMASLLFLFNVVSSLLQFVPRLAILAGCCILVKTQHHRAIGGFDCRCKVLEEYDYLRRIRNEGRHVVIPLAVKTSMRRFQGKNLLKRVSGLFTYYFYWVLKGIIEKDFLGYWQVYDDAKLEAPVNAQAHGLLDV